MQLDWVEAGSDPARRVAFYLDRYHYLGWHVVGQNIGYLARDGSGRDLAVLLFGAAAWRCAPRDRHLDWSESERLIGLHRIANNSRFLIAGPCPVPHLASHLLALVARRINADWQQKYGHGLDWLESLWRWRDVFAAPVIRPPTGVVLAKRAGAAATTATGL